MMENSQEILNVKTIDSGSSCWTRPNSGTWSSETLVKSKSTSLLRFCIMSWENIFKDRKQDGQVRWKNFRCIMQWKSSLESTWMQLNSSEIFLAGFTTLWVIQQIQNDLESEFFEPEQFPDKIIFMSMLNDTDWTKRNIEETCAPNSEKVNCTHRDFRKVTGRLSGLEKKWSVVVQRTTNLGENRNFLASKMVQNFQERKHPVTTSISALNRGILRKIKGKSSRHLVKNSKTDKSFGKPERRSENLRWSTSAQSVLHALWSVSWRKVNPNDFFITKPSLSEGHGGIETFLFWWQVTLTMHGKRPATSKGKTAHTKMRALHLP